MKKLMIALVTLALAFSLSACGHEHDHDHGHHEIVTIEIVDRGQTDRPTVASWTAADGWTGALPEIGLSAERPRISLGVRAITDHGDDAIAEDDHYEARYALAAGAAGGIVDVTRDDTFHGDHIHLYALAAGTTEIEILVWHDDHSDLETDPIAVTVVE